MSGFVGGGWNYSKKTNFVIYCSYQERPNYAKTPTFSPLMHVNSTGSLTQVHFCV